MAQANCGHYCGCSVSPFQNEFRSVVPFENNGSALTVHFVPPVVRTIARMPALIGSGSFGQASMIARNSEAIAPLCASSAPDFAPPDSENPEFLGEFGPCAVPLGVLRMDVQECTPSPRFGKSPCFQGLFAFLET